MAAVQFFGRADTVEAVRNRGIMTWGLFQQKQFITAGDGVTVLDEFLKKLEPGGSSAVYTLKVYKDVNSEEITDKSECNGSFNFKLTEPGSESTSKGYTAIMERLDEMEERISGPGNTDEPENPDLVGVLTGLLQEPEKLVSLVGAVRSLLTMLKGGAPAANILPMPGAVGTINPSPAAKWDQDEGTLQRISAALDRLEKQDPKIVVHLEKLATLSESKPDTFKFFLMQLDGL